MESPDDFLIARTRGENLMRCQEFQEDLTLAWDGRPLSEKVAEHLSACSVCAARFSETQQLAKTWEATRPVVPSESDWESVWSRIEQVVDSPSLPVSQGLASPKPKPKPKPKPNRGRWTQLVPLGLGLSLAAMLFLAFVLPRWNAPQDQVVLTPDDAGEVARTLTLTDVDVPDLAVSAVGTLDIQPGQIAFYRVDQGKLNLVIEESEDFDDFLAFHGHFETLDRGTPIRWFIDVEPGQTILYSVDRDVVTVVDEPDVMAWIPGVDDEFLAFYAEAECEFRFGVLALNGNGEPLPNPFAR